MNKGFQRDSEMWPLYINKPLVQDLINEWAYYMLKKCVSDVAVVCGWSLYTGANHNGLYEVISQTPV